MLKQMMRFVVLHEIIFSDNISFVTMSLGVKLRVKILKFLLSILALRQSPFQLLTTLDVGSKIHVGEELGVKILLLVLVEMLMLQSPGLGVFVRLIFPDSANLENKLMKLMLIMTREMMTVVRLVKSSLLRLILVMAITPMTVKMKLMAAVREVSQMLVVSLSPAITSMEAE